MAICDSLRNPQDLMDDPGYVIPISAQTRFGGIVVAWAPSGFNDHCIAYFRVHRSLSEDFADAIPYRITASNEIYDIFDWHDPATYYYWVQVVALNGTNGPLNGPTSATPMDLTVELMGRLAGSVDSSNLSASVVSQLAQIPILQADLTAETQGRITGDDALAGAMSSFQTDLDALGTQVANLSSISGGGFDDVNARLDVVELLAAANKDKILGKSPRTGQFQRVYDPALALDTLPVNVLNISMAAPESITGHIVTLDSAICLEIPGDGAYALTAYLEDVGTPARVTEHVAISNQASTTVLTEKHGSFTMPGNHTQTLGDTIYKADPNGGSSPFEYSVKSAHYDVVSDLTEVEYVSTDITEDFADADVCWSQIATGEKVIAYHRHASGEATTGTEVRTVAVTGSSRYTVLGAAKVRVELTQITGSLVDPELWSAFGTLTPQL